MLKKQWILERAKIVPNVRCRFCCRPWKQRALLNTKPARILNLIISCGLKSTAAKIIKEAYNKCYLLCVPSMGIIVSKDTKYSRRLKSFIGKLLNYIEPISTRQAGLLWSKQWRKSTGKSLYQGTRIVYRGFTFWVSVHINAKPWDNRNV